MRSLREAYKKEGEARERATAREEGDIAPPEPTKPKLKVNKTFAEIREDDAASAGFLRFLESNGHAELQKSILLAEQDPDKMDRPMLKKLNAEKEKFLLLMERAESTIKALDTQTITNLTEINAGLHDVAEWGGLERINEAIQSKIPKIATGDPVRFEALAKSIENQTKQEKRAEEREKQIRATFKQWDIVNDETIAKLMYGDDPEKAARAVAEKLAQEKFEKEPRRFNWRQLFEKGPSEESIREFQAVVAAEIANFASASEADLKNIERDLAQAKKNIALALEATVMKNKDVHDAVIKGVYGGPAEDIDTMSIKDAGKVMKLDRQDVDKKWEQKVAARHEKARDAFAAPKLEEWLTQQRDIAWQDYMKQKKRGEAIKKLVKEGTPANQQTKEQIENKIDELHDEWVNLPQSEGDKVWMGFLEKYKDPTPPRDLMESWKQDTPDITMEEMGFLQSEFADDYTASHMAAHTKGKKPSYVSRAMSAFFKDMLLTNIFTGPRGNS